MQNNFLLALMVVEKSLVLLKAWLLLEKKIWTWREHGLPENEFQRAFDQAEALHFASGHLDAWRMPSKIQCSGANSSE